MVVGAFRPDPCSSLASCAMPIWRPTRLIDVVFKTEQLATHRSVVTPVAGGIGNDKVQGQARADPVNPVDSRIKDLPSRLGTIAPFHRHFKRNIPAFSFGKHLVGVNATAQV